MTLWFAHFLTTHVQHERESVQLVEISENQTYLFRLFVRCGLFLKQKMQSVIITYCQAQVYQLLNIFSRVILFYLHLVYIIYVVFSQETLLFFHSQHAFLSNQCPSNAIDIQDMYINLLIFQIRSFNAFVIFPKLLNTSFAILTFFI